MIRFTGVSKTFADARRGRIDALDGISLHVEAGSMECVLGPSGCGKTTLLRLAAGLDIPSEGSVHLDGRALEGVARNVGLVFQEYALMPWRTVAGNVAFGLEVMGVGREERGSRVRALLDRFGLAGFAGHYPAELSGGMRQRLAVARSLATDPKILLLDESFSAVDWITRAGLQSFLVETWRATGTTVLFVTHSVEEAVFLGSRIHVLSERPGTLVASIDAPLAHPRDRNSPEFNRIKAKVDAALGSG